MHDGKQKAPRDHEAASRYHPTARQLIAIHDQSSWSVTEDGLICAPVGYYRVLKYIGEHGEPKKALVFGFTPEELALVPHPNDPTKKILAEAAYIFEPVDDDYARGSEGWAEIQMRKHQGDWLAFVRGFGNLYSTPGENGTIYFANNFISYGVFPVYNEAGQRDGYRVTMRANPYNDESGYGLNQDEAESLQDWFCEEGMLLKNCHSMPEVLKFIHHDFRDRLSHFIEHKEVLRWEDPDVINNVRNYAHNLFYRLFLDEPLRSGSDFSKIVDLLVTKLTPAAFMVEAGLERLEESAEREALGTDLEDIAEVEEESPAPLNPMKDEVRMEWAAMARADLDGCLLTDIPECKDLPAQQRARSLDIIHGLEPVLVIAHGSEDDKHIITARTHHGMEIHCVGEDMRIVTFVPGHAQALDAPLPDWFRPFFAEDGIAQVERMAVDSAQADAAYNNIFYRPAHDETSLWTCRFAPLQDVLDFFKNTTQESRILDSIAQHAMPESFTSSTTTEESAPNNPVPPEHPIKAAARLMMHYGHKLHPFNSADDPKDCWLAYGSLLFGAVAANDGLGRIFEIAAPVAFLLAAGFMTKRMSANALTPHGAAKLDAMAQCLFTLGPASGILGFGQAMGEELHKEGFEILKNGEAVKEQIENLAALLVSGALGVLNGRKAARTIRHAVNMHNNDSAAPK